LLIIVNWFFRKLVTGYNRFKRILIFYVRGSKFYILESLYVYYHFWDFIELTILSICAINSNIVLDIAKYKTRFSGGAESKRFTKTIWRSFYANQLEN